MKKLNQNGWGYGFLIASIVVIFLILLSVAIAVKSLKKENKNNKPVPLNETKNYSKMYTLLEEKLKNAGEYYVLDNETYIKTISNSSKLSLKTLQDGGYIDNILDPIYSTPCSGFVIVKSENDITAYIKCSEYSTSGYDLWS